MKNHKWYHHLGFVTQEYSSRKETLLDPKRTVMYNQDMWVQKCSCCDHWQIKLEDYEEEQYHNRPWEPKADAIKWLKDNGYGRLL